MREDYEFEGTKQRHTSNSIYNWSKRTENSLCLLLYLCEREYGFTELTWQQDVARQDVLSQFGLKVYWFFLMENRHCWERTYLLNVCHRSMYIHTYIQYILTETLRLNTKDYTVHQLKSKTRFKWPTTTPHSLCLKTTRRGAGVYLLQGAVCAGRDQVTSPPPPPCPHLRHFPDL